MVACELVHLAASYDGKKGSPGCPFLLCEVLMGQALFTLIFACAVSAMLRMFVPAVV
jgi:hypothetical protein